MPKVKTSPTALQKLIEEADHLTLSQSKISLIKHLAETELERRTCGNTLSEFHQWIKRGDSILNALEQELSQLRAVTSPEGEYISKAAVLEILTSLSMSDESDRCNKAINWVLSQAQKAIVNLPALPAPMEKEG